MKALITGTSAGIGRACAELFLQRGWHVYGFDIAPASIAHAEYEHFVVDVRDRAALFGGGLRRGTRGALLGPELLLELRKAIVRILDAVQLLARLFKIREHLLDARAVLLFQPVELVTARLHRVELLR